MHKLFPILLVLGLVVINAYFVWRGLSVLSAVAETVDLKPPDITVLEPEMDTTVRLAGNALRVHARVWVSDESWLENMYIVMAEKRNWSEEGVILRLGSEEIKG